MSLTTTTHLNFRGEARAALEFYASVFGGDPMVLTYADAQAVGDPSEADQVMWGQVIADSGVHVMAYDVPSTMPFERGENSFFVSLRGDSPDEITQHWQRLAEGATIVADLAPASWSPMYGMLEDRFGIVWVLDVAPAY